MTRLRRLRVLKEVGKLFVDFGRMRLRGELTAASRARRVRELIEHMGGLWIKFGQLIALRHDAFSPELCDELGNLQDSANAFPIEIMRPEMERQLGASLDEVFVQFEEHPVAAASIAQVHKARLRRNGVEVAIKVQKPSARQMFKKDLAMIRSLTKMLELFGILRYFDWNEAIRELEQIIDEELDYRIEASSLDDMRKLLKKHKVFAPKVYFEQCNTVMLTMEYLHGVFMTDYLHVMRQDPKRVEAWCRENDINPKKVAKRLLQSQLRQIFEDNHFHGDLHPGNILLFRNSRYGLIDFGSVGTLDANFVTRYRMSIGALSAGEYEKAADLMLLFTPELPHVDLRKVRDDMVIAWRHWASRSKIKNVPYHERSLASAGDAANAVSLKYKIKPNWMLLKIGRAWSTLDASLAHLYEDLSYLKEITRYGKKSGRRQIKRVPAQLLRLPNTLEEINILVAPRLRERALTIKATASKAARIATIAFRVAAAGLAAAGGYFAWVFLGQHHGDTMIENFVTSLVGPFMGPRLHELRETLPHLTLQAWLVVLLLTLLTFYVIRRSVKILLEPDQPTID